MRPERRSLLARLSRGDDGVSAILVSLFIVFLVVPVAAVSVDLSNSYSNRREMQNAADAAAQAGAQELNQVRTKVVTANFGQLLDSTVSQVATANGVNTSDPRYSCRVATVSYPASGQATVVPGPSCLSWNGDVTTYNAVTVHTAHDANTFFADALFGGGTAATSAGATATATIQAISNQYVGLSPFAMCAYAYTGNGAHQTISTALPGLLVQDTSNPIPSTSPQQYYYKINTAAEGTNYSVWSNGGGSSNVSDCGLNSQNFNGLICGLYDPPSNPTNSCVQPIVLPSNVPPISLPANPANGGWLSITNGAVVGPTLATYAGFPACHPSDFSGTTVSFTPCAMAVPICDGGQDAGSGVPALLHCITFGLFYLTPGVQHSSDPGCDQTPGVTQHTICGKFIGPAVDVVGGTPTSGTPGLNDPVRIALVQ